MGMVGSHVVLSNPTAGNRFIHSCRGKRARVQKQTTGDGVVIKHK